MMPTLIACPASPGTARLESARSIISCINIVLTQIGPGKARTTGYHGHSHRPASTYNGTVRDARPVRSLVGTRYLTGRFCCGGLPSLLAFGLGRRRAVVACGCVAHFLCLLRVIGLRWFGLFLLNGLLGWFLGGAQQLRRFSGRKR